MEVKEEWREREREAEERKGEGEWEAGTEKEGEGGKEGETIHLDRKYGKATVYFLMELIKDVIF